MKKIVPMMFFLALSLMVFAQPSGDNQDEKRKERIERLKRAFISERLDLTVAEAEKFWPVYNEYNDQKQELRKAIHKADKKMREADSNEKETIATIDEISQKKKEEVDLDQKFLKDSLPILGVAKVQTLMGLEDEFRKALMEKLKEKRSENGGVRPGARRG